MTSFPMIANLMEVEFNRKVKISPELAFGGVNYSGMTIPEKIIHLQKMREKAKQLMKTVKSEKEFTSVNKKTGGKEVHLDQSERNQLWSRIMTGCAKIKQLHDQLVSELEQQIKSSNDEQREFDDHVKTYH